MIRNKIPACWWQSGRGRAPAGWWCLQGTNCEPPLLLRTHSTQQEDPSETHAEGRVPCFLPRIPIQSNPIQYADQSTIDRPWMWCGCVWMGWLEHTGRLSLSVNKALIISGPIKLLSPPAVLGDGDCGCIQRCVCIPTPASFSTAATEVKDGTASCCCGEQSHGSIV